MKKFAAAVLMLAGVACASAPDDGVLPAAAPLPAPDPRIAEMQTAMTELLERMDVLNHRIAKLEEERATEVSSSAPAPVTAREMPQPQRALASAKIADDYRQAIMLFGRGKHADARRAFQEVFEADSSGDLADNALFWIGETYFAATDYTNALRFYARVTNEYPDENKAPDALFKTALTHARTSDLALARKTLQQVIERYPFSSAAAAAKAELQRIRF
jgi:tol-pal system protein YbgF